MNVPSVPKLFKQPTSGPSFHLVIEGRYAKAYWMHVAAPLAAPLSKLDRFLRDTWLECCGHLSAFHVGPIIMLPRLTVEKWACAFLSAGYLR